LNAAENVFNSPINTNEQLQKQLDQILSEVAGDHITLQGQTLSEKIAMAAQLNLFQKIQDPILTEEELVKRADGEF
jgi:hypothetical protein